MAPSRFERLCRPKLFELRYLLLAKLSTEHQHDRIMAQKQLAELAISPDILDLARQGVRQHIASMIHSMVYELAARISKNAYTKDTLPDTIDSMANKIWELFLNNMFGRGSWTKAEAFARLLLHETACFLRVSSWNAEEKQEFVNYYARECTSDKLFSIIFCDKFETRLFQTFDKIVRRKTDFVHSGLFEEVWSIYRKLLRKYRHDICAPRAVRALEGWSHVENS